MKSVSIVILVLGCLLVSRVFLFRPDPPDMPAIQVWCVAAGAVLSLGLVLCGKTTPGGLTRLCRSLPRTLTFGLLTWLAVSGGLYGWHLGIQ